MSARMTMMTMPVFANAGPRHDRDPLALGVCSQISRSLAVPVRHVRAIAALAIAVSLVVPGLLAYALLGHTLRARRAFHRTQQQRTRIARGGYVLEAYIDARQQ